jgi:hypothetical protein
MVKLHLESTSEPGGRRACRRTRRRSGSLGFQTLHSTGPTNRHFLSHRFWSYMDGPSQLLVTIMVTSGESDLALDGETNVIRDANARKVR